jgi:peptidyl-prolyl cis-trans isomerase C
MASYSEPLLCNTPIAPPTTRPAWLASVLHNRLVHFLCIGVILYGLGPKTSPNADTRIEISRDYLASRKAAQAQRLGVSSLPQSAADEVERRTIEDEVLFREALRLGLDKDDALVRQHLVSKVLLLAEDLGGGGQTPSEVELRAFYDSTKTRWTKGETIHFVHVFASQREAAEALRARLPSSQESAPPTLGEPLSVSRDVRDGRANIAATFGPGFADSVVALPLNTWSTPLDSKFGWHLVKVLAHDAGGQASYEEARSALMLEFVIERRKRATDAFLRRAFSRYDVRIDGARLDRYEPAGRMGRRTEPSEED